MDDQAAEKARGTPSILAANEVIGEEGGTKLPGFTQIPPSSEPVLPNQSSCRLDKAAGAGTTCSLYISGSQGTAE